MCLLPPNFDELPNKPVTQFLFPNMGKTGFEGEVVR